MQNSWPELSKFIYPGRFLILSRVQNDYYSIYGVTARSEPSRAKKYIYDQEQNIIKVETTNLDVMSRGNLNLLDYNAGYLFNNGLVLGNGKQTDVVKLNESAIKSLMQTLQSQTYEPDKYNTPRITSALYYNNNSVSAGMYIIKSGWDSEPVHQAYDLLLNPGQGYFISTYDGSDIRPTPSFSGDPLLIKVDFDNEQDAAQKTYDFFAPIPPKPDLRVSVVAIRSNPSTKTHQVYIINNTDYDLNNK
jgi:IMP cyclohydrolase